MGPSPQQSMQSQLQQLRDIHLPDTIGVWPPAIGWWVLAIISIALLYATITFSLRKYRTLAPRRQALKELQQLEARYDSNQSQQTLRELSALLKRVALAYYPRHQVAKLSDDAWLQFLDRTGKEVNFKTGPANALVKHRYQPDSAQSTPAAIGEIFNTCKQWIKSQQ